MLNTIPISPGRLYGCLDTLYRLRYPAYLAGPPGIGKSAVVRQFAWDRELRLVTRMLSQIEPSDVRGFPFLDRETGRTRWLIPEFYLASEDESAGILFLDELGNAEPRVQVAAYQLLLDRSRIAENRASFRLQSGALRHPPHRIPSGTAGRATDACHGSRCLSSNRSGS